MSMGTLQGIADELRARGIRLVKKQGHWWGILHWMVVIATLGTNRSFRDRYATTIGTTIGVPPAWTEQGIGSLRRALLLAHEPTHVDQTRSLGMGSVRLGVVVMFLIYVFLPLPMGVAWCRWVLEREAYVNGYRMVLRDVGDRPEIREQLVDHGVRQITTGAYAWTMAWWLGLRPYVRAWFQHALEEGAPYIEDSL